MDINKTKAGELISFTQYLKVVEITPEENSVIVSTETGKLIKYSGVDLIEAMKSSSQYEKEVSMTKNQLVNLMSEARDRIMTINFTKLDGSTRNMICRYLKAEPNLGRTLVKDLEVPSPENAMRQVDNRTINHIILDNILYKSKI